MGISICEINNTSGFRESIEIRGRTRGLNGKNQSPMDILKMSFSDVFLIKNSLGMWVLVGFSEGT